MLDKESECILLLPGEDNYAYACQSFEISEEDKNEFVKKKIPEEKKEIPEKKKEIPEKKKEKEIPEKEKEKEKENPEENIVTVVA